VSRSVEKATASLSGGAQLGRKRPIMLGSELRELLFEYSRHEGRDTHDRSVLVAVALGHFW
jgi:hypothetical protein